MINKVKLTLGQLASLPLNHMVLYTVVDSYVRDVVIMAEAIYSSSGQIIYELTDDNSEATFLSTCGTPLSPYDQFKVDDISPGKISLTWDTLKAYSNAYNTSNPQFRLLNMPLLYSVEGGNAKDVLVLATTPPGVAPHMIFHISDAVDAGTFAGECAAPLGVVSIEIFNKVCLEVV